MKSKMYFVLCIAILSFVCCIAIEEKKHSPKMKDGKIYGITRGLFNYNFWDYYERALSFADGEFWEDAESDLSNALKIRNNDKRDVPTYGMHYIDYFPHRELGVVYYNLNRLQDAEKEIKKSLDKEPSAKAKKYIDIVRKELGKKDDIYQPEIIITSPINKYITNDFSVPVVGVAKDDTYISDIEIDGKKVPIEYADKEIRFREIVMLNKEKNQTGENNIKIAVTDVSGKSSTKDIKVYSDNMGPIISFDPPYLREGNIIIDGEASDPSGVIELDINGKKMSYKDAPKEISLPNSSDIKASQSHVNITAKDKLGNTTSVSIPLSKLISKKHLLLAESRMIKSDANIKDNSPPTITINSPKENHKTYYKKVDITGNAEDNTHVESITIDGKETKFNKHNRKMVSFHDTVNLRKGDNTYEIRAVDIFGNSQIKKIKISRDIPDFDKISLGFAPFQRKCERKNETAFCKEICAKYNDFEENLSLKIDNNRFKNKHYDLKDELKQNFIISGECDPSSIDEAKILKIAEQLKIDYVVFGKISLREKEYSLDVRVRSVDKCNDPNPLKNDFYEKAEEKLNKYLCDILPLLEGTIKIENKVIAEIDDNAKIEKCRKIFIYEENTIQSDNELKIRPELVGHGRVLSNSNIPDIELSPDTDKQKIKVGQRIITQ